MDKAIADLAKRFALSPTMGALKGGGRPGQGEYDKAILDCDHVLRINPKDGQSLYYRAMLSRSRMIMTKPSGPFRGNRLEPKRMEILWGRGRAFFRKRNRQGDRGFFCCNPPGSGCGGRVVRQGILYSHKEELAKALADYTEAIRLNPKNVKAFLYRGMVRRHARQYEEAFADFAAAIKIDPKSSDGYLGRAVTAAFLKSYPDALKDFEQAAQLAPKDTAVWRRYAYFLSTCPETKFRDGKKAMEMAKRSIELAGKEVDWQHYEALATAHAELGQFDKALAEQAKVLADKSMDKEERQKQEKRLELYKKAKPFREDS